VNAGRKQLRFAVNEMSLCQLRLNYDSFTDCTTLRFLFDCYTVNLRDAVTLGGAYDGGEASPVGLWGHLICCSGR